MKVEAFFELRDNISRQLEVISGHSERAEQGVAELDREVDELGRQRGMEVFAAKMKVSLGTTQRELGQTKRDVAELIAMTKVLGATSGRPNIGGGGVPGVGGARTLGGGGGRRSFFGIGIGGLAAGTALLGPPVVQAAAAGLGAGGAFLGAGIPAAGGLAAAYGGGLGLYSGAAGAPAIAAAVTAAQETKGLKGPERREALRESGFGLGGPPKEAERSMRMLRELNRSYNEAFATGRRGEQQFSLMNRSIRWAGEKGIPLLGKVWDDFFPILDKNITRLEDYFGDRQGREDLERWSDAFAGVAEEMLPALGQGGRLLANLATGFAPFAQSNIGSLAEWFGDKADWAESRAGMSAMNRLTAEAQPILDETIDLLGAFGTGFVDLLQGESGDAAVYLLDHLADSTLPAFVTYLNQAAPHTEEFVEVLGDLTHTAGVLFGPGAAFQIGLTLLSDFATVVSEVVDALGPLGPALMGGGASLYLMNRLVGSGSMLGAMGGFGRRGAVPAGGAQAGLLGAGLMGGIGADIRAGFSPPGTGFVSPTLGVAGPAAAAPARGIGSRLGGAVLSGLGLSGGVTPATLGKFALRGLGVAGLGYGIYTGIKSFVDAGDEPEPTLSQMDQGAFADYLDPSIMRPGAPDSLQAALERRGVTPGGALSTRYVDEARRMGVNPRLAGPGFAVEDNQLQYVGWRRDMDAEKQLTEQTQQRALSVEDMVGDYERITRQLKRHQDDEKRYQDLLRQRRVTAQQIETQAPELAKYNLRTGAVEMLRGNAVDRLITPAAAGIGGPAELLQRYGMFTSRAGRLQGATSRLREAMVARGAGQPALAETLGAAASGDLLGLTTARAKYARMGPDVGAAFTRLISRVERFGGGVGTAAENLRDLQDPLGQLRTRISRGAGAFAGVDVADLGGRRGAGVAGRIPNALQQVLEQARTTDSQALDDLAKNSARTFIRSALDAMEVSGQQRRRARRLLNRALGLNEDGTVDVTPEIGRAEFWKGAEKTGYKGEDVLSAGLAQRSGADAFSGRKSAMRAERAGEDAGRIMTDAMRRSGDARAAGEDNVDAFNRGALSKRDDARKAGDRVMGAVVEDSWQSGRNRTASRDAGRRHVTLFNVGMASVISQTQSTAGRVADAARLGGGTGGASAQGGAGRGAAPSGGGGAGGPIRDAFGTVIGGYSMGAAMGAPRRRGEERARHGRPGGRGGDQQVVIRDGMGKQAYEDGRAMGKQILRANRPQVGPGVSGPLSGPRTLRRAIRVAQSRFGLSISSLERPSDPDSYHNPDYSPPHQAVDLSGAAEGMAGFTRYALKHWNPLELFYDPLGGWDAGTSIGAIGGHTDHVHIAFRGGGRGHPALGMAMGRAMGTQPHGHVHGLPRDAMSARLSGNEFILTPDGQQMVKAGMGTNALNQIEAMQRPAFAGGGEVSRAAGARVTGGGANGARRGGSRPQLHLHFHGDVGVSGRKQAEMLAGEIAKKLDRDMLNLPEGAAEMTHAG